MKTINHYSDLGYSISMEHNENKCDFTIYQINHIDQYDGDDDDDVEVEYFYEKKDSNNEYTTNLDESVVFIKGYVKWDGCSNWEVDNDDVMIHGCSRQHLVNVGEIMARCYDMANDAGYIS